MGGPPNFRLAPDSIALTLVQCLRDGLHAVGADTQAAASAIGDFFAADVAPSVEMYERGMAHLG